MAKKQTTTTKGQAAKAPAVARGVVAKKRTRAAEADAAAQEDQGDQAGAPPAAEPLEQPEPPQQMEQQPPAEASGPARRNGTKRTVLIGLLRRPGGATVASLGEALGWQPHTVRAALTGLRKDGFVLDKQKGDAGSVYSLPV